jgi:hypothetical protein
MYVAMLQLTAPVVKSIPEIIKQASQSERGILALLAILISGLAWYFFRRVSIGIRVFIWLILFGGAVLYGWEITRVATKPLAVHYVGHVVDKVSKAAIAEALVSLMPATQTQPWTSDSDGRFSFWVERRKPSDDVQMRIDHPKYEKYMRTVSSDESSQLGDVPLSPLVTASVAGEVQPGPPPPAASTASSPPESVRSAEVTLRVPVSVDGGIKTNRSARSGNAPRPDRCRILRSKA